MLDIAKKVLQPPQHLHVQICCYDEWTEAGPKGKHCDIIVVTNDESLAINQAKDMSHLPNGHLAGITQCSEVQHLEGIETT